MSGVIDEVGSTANLCRGILRDLDRTKATHTIDRVVLERILQGFVDLAAEQNVANGRLAKRQAQHVKDGISGFSKASAEIARQAR